MDDLYLDLLPDELICIITTYLITSNPLINISTRYKTIHDNYIKSVHDGFINPFGYVNINGKYPRYEKIIGKKREIIDVEHIIMSTSHYLKNNDRFNFINDVDLPGISNNSLIKHLIYYKSLYMMDFLRGSGESTYIVVFINNDNLYEIVKLDGTGVSKLIPITSKSWKDIWDKLELYDQNAILYQNGFP